VYSQNPLPTALLAYLANIPLRLGYCHEDPYQLLTHWIPDPEPVRYISHEVARQLALVKTIGCSTMERRLSLQIPERAFSRAKKMLQQYKIDRSRPWFILHPGGTEALRCYSPTNFITAAKDLAKKMKATILVTGSRNERRLTTTVAKGIGPAAYNLGGELTLAEYCALIALCPVIITNNTLPAHLAAAVGTPVVDIYATTNPQHTPWLTPHHILYFDIPCRACAQGVCAQPHGRPRRVSPQQIVQAALTLYGQH